MPRGNSSCLLTKGNKKSRGEFPATPARPCGSSKQRATTQPVRRAFPNSLCLCSKRILTGVSNTWKGSFLLLRNKILRALPWPSASAQWRRKMLLTKAL